MTQTAPLICPICGRSDQIQKVKAIVSAGTTTVASTLVSSDLSKRLAAPQKRVTPAPSRPTLDSFNGTPPDLGCSTFIIAACIILFVLYVIGDFIDQLVRNPGISLFFEGAAIVGVLIGIPVLLTWLWRWW